MLPPQAARDAAIAEAIKSATIFFICVFLLSVNSVSGLHPFRGDLSVVLFRFFSNYYLAHLFYNLAIPPLFGTSPDFCRYLLCTFTIYYFLEKLVVDKNAEYRLALFSLVQYNDNILQNRKCDPLSHINYSFNQDDDSLPRDKMKLRNIASTRYSGDWPSIPHSHSYAELFYIVDGAGQFQINDRLFPVRAHQLVVVNPNVIHTEVSLESHPLEYIVLGIEGLEFTISDTSEGSFCVYTFDGNNDVLPCMRKILTEMQNRESNFQILCQAYMDIIVVQLMRNASVSAVPIHSRLPANRQCATVKRYIDHHYKENLTLDELAEKVSISKYHMAHAFKREYGVSPINYIIDCRIQEGKRLLAETDLAPSQIASILGFSSSSYFCKTFSNIEGTSPTEYRKANQVKF